MLRSKQARKTSRANAMAEASLPDYQTPTTARLFSSLHDSAAHSRFCVSHGGQKPPTVAQDHTQHYQWVGAREVDRLCV